MLLAWHCLVAHGKRSMLDDDIACLAKQKMKAGGLGHVQSSSPVIMESELFVVGCYTCHYSNTVRLLTPRRFVGVWNQQ